jgi:hypothetical protein
VPRRQAKPSPDLDADAKSREPWLFRLTQAVAAEPLGSTFGPPAYSGTRLIRIKNRCVVTPLLEEPVADRTNWTITRLRAEIEVREGVHISRSQLSKALRKKSSVGGGPGTR